MNKFLLRKSFILLFIFFNVINILQAGTLPITNNGKSFSLAPMLEQVTPAVVNISVTTSSPMADNPLFNDPFFRQFFEVPEAQSQQSAGSGVIIDAGAGIIVTNYHVINRAREVVVTLKDRREFPAKLIGVDPQTDIAVIAITPNKLTAIKLGDSDVVEVGDFVAAIGNPFAIGQTVTSGIVSGLGRSGLNVRNFEDFIQTDAAINPGNSGGALVNLRGELIGINSNIISPAGASVGIGFAIPVNMVKAIVSQIRATGRVQRGAFGVEIQDLTPALAESLGINVSEGAVIARVQNGSHAQLAGIVQGDVVIELNNRKILSANHLRSQLALIPQNTKFSIKFLRKGKIQTLNTVMSATKTPANTRNPPTPPKNNSNNPQSKNTLEDSSKLGVTFANSDLGVIIKEVQENSPAQNWGLQVGDIVLAINEQKIESIADIPMMNKNEINIALKRGNSIIQLIRR